MEINVRISFEERFLGALERLVGVCNCQPATLGLKSLDEIKDTPATAPASTFPKGESAQAPAQGKTESPEKQRKKLPKHLHKKQCQQKRLLTLLSKYKLLVPTLQEREKGLNLVI